jgi:hypothetical protein
MSREPQDRSYTRTSQNAVNAKGVREPIAPVQYPWISTYMGGMPPLSTALAPSIPKVPTTIFNSSNQSTRRFFAASSRLLSFTVLIAASRMRAKRSCGSGGSPISS